MQEKGGGPSRRLFLSPRRSWIGPMTRFLSAGLSRVSANSVIEQQGGAA